MFVGNRSGGPQIRLTGAEFNVSDDTLALTNEGPVQ